MEKCPQRFAPRLSFSTVKCMFQSKKVLCEWVSDSVHKPIHWGWRARASATDRHMRTADTLIKLCHTYTQNIGCIKRKWIQNELHVRTCMYIHMCTFILTACMYVCMCIVYLYNSIGLTATWQWNAYIQYTATTVPERFGKKTVLSPFR